MSLLTPPDRLRLSVLESAIGPLGLAVDDEDRLRGVSFGDRALEALSGVRRAMQREYPGAQAEDGDAPSALVDLLDAFLGGDLSALARIDWSLEGAVAGAGFQARVWRELASVPVGTTITYGEMAKRAGEPGAAQAAGVALNRNPIPLVLPCHRVVGADGAMVGFGGGLERKTWLLRHEGALLL